MKNKSSFFNLSVLIAMLFAILFTFGCSDDGKDGNKNGNYNAANAAAIVGTWVDDVSNTYYNYEYSFKSDKTGVYSYYVKEQENPDKIEEEFTWTAEGNVIILTYTEEGEELVYPGGNTWDIFGNGDIYTRTSGSGSSVVGTWEIGDGEEIVEFKNGKMTIYDSGDKDGPFDYTQNGNKVTFIDISTEKFEYNGGNTFKVVEEGDAIFTKKQ